MPELPEVEVMTRRIRRWCVGGVVSLEIRDPRVLQRGPSTVEGLATAAWRRAKYSVLEVGSQALVMHFRMTGQLMHGEADASCRFSLHTTHGPAVHFRDPRRMGHLWVLDLEAVEPFFDALWLGPDAWPLLRGGAWWRERMSGLHGPIKPALLRQDRVAGIGNIQAAEALWTAGIAPARAVSGLTAAEWEALAVAVHATMEETIAQADTHDPALVYVNEGGPNPFRVYDRDGEPCPRCGAAIVRSVQAGRGTWSCAGCQS